MNRLASSHDTNLTLSFATSASFPLLISVLATYGGHLELSAFAHMTKRNVKVIQPGLVYVIEWNAGGDFGDSSAQGDDDPNLDDREKRRQRRERRRSEQEQAAADDEETPISGTVYVAYVYPFGSSWALS